MNYIGKLQILQRTIFLIFIISAVGCGGSSSSGGDPVAGGGGGGGGADTTDPTFAGVDSLEQAGTTRMVINWSDATDNASNSNNIIYNIYLATTTGMQNYAMPTATSTLGANSIVLTGLTANTNYFVVVRAEDEAMNEDNNTSELSTTTVATVTTLSGDVQTIFNNECISCHGMSNIQAGLNLDDGIAFGELVNVNSIQCNPVEKLVTPNNANASYLITKLISLGCGAGDIMPPGVADTLPAETIQIVKNWIWDGALDN